MCLLLLTVRLLGGGVIKVDSRMLLVLPPRPSVSVRRAARTTRGSSAETQTLHRDPLRSPAAGLALTGGSRRAWSSQDRSAMGCRPGRRAEGGEGEGEGVRPLFFGNPLPPLLFVLLHPSFSTVRVEPGTRARRMQPTTCPPPSSHTGRPNTEEHTPALPYSISAIPCLRKVAPLQWRTDPGPA